VTTFEKWSVWVTSALVFATGFVYLGMKYWLPAPAGFSIVRHPLQPLFLKLHVLSAPLLLLALGAIALRHVWRHFITGTRQGRASGLASVLTAGSMVLTGYLLQVFTDEGWLRVLALAHIMTGLVYGAALLVHQIMVRRRRAGGSEIIAKGDRRHKPPRKTGVRRIPSS
jgi:hypothetical protein